MDTIIINASPRPEGNSAFLASKFKEKYGDKCRLINLAETDIKSCRACRSCRTNNSLCVMDDSMKDIYPGLLAAERIIFISPNHFGFLSSLGKIFADRWYCLKTESRKSRFEEGKKALFFLVQGDPSRDRGKNICEWARHFFTSYGFKYFAMTIPGCSDDNADGVKNKLDEAIMSASIF